MYEGRALSVQQVQQRQPIERFWVRDFDTSDSTWPEGYELRDVDEGPFTRAAAESLAALLNGRPKAAGIEFRVCEGKSKWSRDND